MIFTKNYLPLKAFIPDNPDIACTAEKVSALVYLDYETSEECVWVEVVMSRHQAKMLAHGLLTVLSESD